MNGCLLQVATLHFSRRSCGVVNTTRGSTARVHVCSVFPLELELWIGLCLVGLCLITSNPLCRLGQRPWFQTASLFPRAETNHPSNLLPSKRLLSSASKTPALPSPLPTTPSAMYRHLTASRKASPSLPLSRHHWAVPVWRTPSSPPPPTMQLLSALALPSLWSMTASKCNHSSSVPTAR